MPLISSWARKRKIEYFFNADLKDKDILEIGCGEGWLIRYAKKNGWKGYVGLDLIPPADIVGDIKNWRQLGIKKASYDLIIAFEVVEHIDCIQECFDLLRSGGQLFITTPVPHMDWLCKILEKIGLNQKRTSPHNCVYLKEIPLLTLRMSKTIMFMAQWAIFEKEDLQT